MGLRHARRSALVVEDDPTQRTVLMRIVRLVDPGAEVEWAAGGDEALALFGERARTRSRPYDLVIADITLEGRVTGLDLWNGMKVPHPDVPFLFVSGMALPDFLKAVGTQAPAPPYLCKPLYPGECRQVIESLFNVA